MNEEDLEADAIFADIDSQEADNLFAAIDSESEPNQSIGSPAPRPAAPRIEQPPLFGMRGPVVDTINDFTRKTVPFSHQIAGAWEGLTNPDDVSGDLSERYAHYRDTSRQQEDQFAVDNPRTSGITDVAGTTAQLVGTAGMGGTAVAGKLAKLKQLQALGWKGKALAGAGGAGVTGAGLTASKSRAETAGERLVDMAKGAGTTAAFGAAGAVKPALTMVAGTGLGLVDASEAAVNNDTRGVTAALTDTALNLAGVRAGRKAGQTERAGEYQKRFDSARNQVDDSTALAKALAQKDVELSDKLLSTNQDRRGAHIAEQANAEVERLTKDNRSRNEKFDKDLDKLVKEQNQHVKLLAVAQRRLEQAEKIRDSKNSTAAQKQKAKDDTTNLSKRIKQVQKVIEGKAREIMAAKGEAARAPAEGKVAASELAIAKAERKLEEGPAAPVDPEQDPAMIRSKAALEQAEIDAKPENIELRVTQKARADRGGTWNRANNVLETLERRPDLKAEHDAMLKAAEHLDQVQRDYLKNTNIDDFLNPKTDKEVQDLYRDELTRKTQADLEAARAAYEGRLKKLAAKPELSEADRRILSLELETAKAQHRDLMKQGSPERQKLAATTAANKADIYRVVPKDFMDQAFRDFGLEVDTSDPRISVGTRLATRDVKDLRAQPPPLPGQSPDDIRIQGLKQDVDRLMQELRSATGREDDHVNAWDLLGPQKIMRLAARRDLDPNDLSRDMFEPTPDGRPRAPISDMPGTNTPIGTPFRPGDAAASLRFDEAEIKLRDKKSRAEKKIAELDRDSQDVARLTEEPPPGQSWEDANFDGAPERAFRAKLEGSPVGSTSVLGNLAETIRMWNTTGTANPLKIKAHQIAAQDPLAGAYFYEQMARNLRVPEDVIRRNSAFVSAQGAKAGIRLEKVLDKLFEWALKNSPTE